MTGVARAEKLEFVRSLGVDRVIDYTAVDYTRTGEQYDWIVDVDAHHPIRRWRDALRPGGAYVALGGSASWLLASAAQGAALSRTTGRWMGPLLWWKPFNSDDVDSLKQLIAEGKVKPAIDRRFALGDVVEALRCVDDGRAKGKVAITL